MQSECFDLRQRVVPDIPMVSVSLPTLETHFSSSSLNMSTPQRFIACGPLAVSAPHNGGRLCSLGLPSQPRIFS